jgi:hypothetical protein
MLISVLDESSFAASSGMDLRFDNGDRAAQIGKRLGGFIGRLRDSILKHFDAKFAE